VAESTLINANTPASPIEVVAGTLHISGVWGGAAVLVKAGTAVDNPQLVGRITEHDECKVYNLSFAEVMFVSSVLANVSPATNLTVRLVYAEAA
jgi:hypothetical protein